MVKEIKQRKTKTKSRDKENKLMKNEEAFQQIITD